MNMKLSLAIAALLLAPGVARSGPAVDLMASADAIPSVVVRFDDLDLSTKQGVKTLQKRIRRAAYLVCRDMIERPSIENAKCQEQLVQAAVHDVNAKLRLAGRDTQVILR